MKELIDMFLTFARIGGLTFGGGYAMLPMLQQEVVDKKHWATSEELMDYYAIGQCTPGIIAINTATFVGYKTRGIIGGIMATLGVVSPSLVIISIITACLQNFAQYPVVIAALSGIRICVCVLVLNAVITLGKKSIIDGLSVAVFLIVLFCSMFTSLPSALIVIAVGIIGCVIKVKGEKKP